MKKNKKESVEKVKEPLFSVVFFIGNGKFEQKADTIFDALKGFSLESIGDLGAGAILSVTSGDKKYETNITPFQIRNLLANEDAKKIFENNALALISPFSLQTK